MSSAPDHNRTVLVVDDDPRVIAVLHDALTDSGIDVGSAADGSRALAWIREHGAPDAVVTDLDMPGIDGRELVATLRRDPSLAAVPVFVVTASVLDVGNLAGMEGIAILDKATQLSRLPNLIESTLVGDARGVVGDALGVLESLPDAAEADVRLEP